MGDIMDSILAYLKINKDAFSLIINFITSIIAFSGLFWTLFSGLKSFKNYSKNKTNEHLSNLIELFSDNNKIKRLSSANSLVHYCDSMFKEIFLLCIVENDFFIKSILYESLIKNSKKCYDDAIFLNKSYTKLLITYITPDFNFFELSNEDINLLLFFYRDARIDSEITKKYILNFEIDSFNEKDVVNCIILSSKIIANLLDLSKITKIGGLIFVSSDFYQKNMIKKIFSNCIFFKNIFRHTKICYISFNKCFFLKENDFYGVEFVSVHFNNNKINNCIFRETKFANLCKFLQSDIKNSIFSSSVFIDTIIDINELYKNKFKGCDFTKLQFKINKSIKNEYQGSCFHNSIFEESNIWSSNFNSCRFYNCNFQKVNFGGTDLRNVIYKECLFEDVNFAGADLKNIKFIQCEFKHSINFEKSKNLETVSFENCKGYIYKLSESTSS